MDRRLGPARRRKQGARGAVQDRPFAYAESARPLRHRGLAGKPESLMLGDRNVAEALVGAQPGDPTKAIVPSIGGRPEVGPWIMLRGSNGAWEAWAFVVRLTIF